MTGNFRTGVIAAAAGIYMRRGHFAVVVGVMAMEMIQNGISGGIR